MRNGKIGYWVCALGVSGLLGCAGGQKAVTDAATGTSTGKQVTSYADGTGLTGTSGGSSGGTSGGVSGGGGAAGGAVSAGDADVQGDVIAVTISASKDLNTFNNQPHTLVLVLYQLSQSSVFSQFLDTPEGKAKLLAGDSFDATVLSRRRLVVQPGETQRVILDRVEGARYLAAVAGFYNIQTQDMSRLLPVVRETTGMLSWKKPKPQIVHFTLGKGGFAQ